MKLTFEKGTAEYIVESFGKEIDDKGYVINPETGKREQHRGRDVTKENLAIVEDGSDIFVDDSFDSLSEHVERARE
jgi:hypothetical protein